MKFPSVPLWRVQWFITDIRRALSNFFNPDRKYHLERVGRASEDPNFKFEMLDGCLNALISKETGCIVFERKTGGLSPMNMVFILLFLEQNPKAKAFLADALIPFQHHGIAPRTFQEAKDGKTWTQLLEESKAGTRGTPLRRWSEITAELEKQPK